MQVLEPQEGGEGWGFSLWIQQDLAFALPSGTGATWTVVLRKPEQAVCSSSPRILTTEVQAGPLLQYCPCPPRYGGSQCLEPVAQKGLSG